MSGPRFLVLDPSLPDERQSWIDAWSRTTSREPHAHPAYGHAMTSESGRILCAVASRGTESVILPFVVRPLPFSSSTIFTHDAATPYGYGGAFSQGNIQATWFWREWDAWAISRGISGIVVRNHLFSEEVLAAPGASIAPLQNVVLDLTATQDELWQRFEGRVRTSVRRAREYGVRVVVDESATTMSTFHALYLQTMAKKSAGDFYRFSLATLNQLVSGIPGGVVLCHAYVDDRLVASEMQLLGTVNSYYFLSGATAEGRAVNANPVMKLAVINHLKERGCTRYVLGGGMSRGDSLFRYKRGYAPSGVTDFTLTSHESREGLEATLTEERATMFPTWRPAAGYIPEYRAPDDSSPSHGSA